MVGILNLKFENQSVEDNFDRLWLHLEKVGSLKNKLTNFNLSGEELNLVEYQLNNIPADPTSYRFESKASRQTNLLYRTEGVLGWIWEKIKAFFKWIKEKFMQLFGMGSSDTNEKLNEVKTTLKDNVKNYTNVKPLHEKVTEQAKNLASFKIELPDGTIVTDFKKSPSAAKAVMDIKKITLKTFRELAGSSVSFKSSDDFKRSLDNLAKIGNDYRTLTPSFSLGIKSFEQTTLKKALEEFSNNLLGSTGLPSMFGFEKELTGDFKESHTGFLFCGASKIILLAFSVEKEKIFRKIINCSNNTDGKDPSDKEFLKAFDELVESNSLDSILKLCEGFKDLSSVYEKSFTGLTNKAEADFEAKHKEPTEESKKIFEALKVYLTTMLEFASGFNAFYANMVNFLSRVNTSLGRVTAETSKADLEQMMKDTNTVIKI